MKILIATVLILVGTPLFAQQSSGSSSTTEGTAALNCDHQVPGTSCPAKYASSCKTLFCDTQVREATTPNPPSSKTDK